MYDTSFSWDKLETAIGDLKKYEFKDTELSALSDLSTYLTNVSSNHCGYLGETCTTLDPSVSDGMAAYLASTNNAYNGFIAKLENAYNQRSIDENGGVNYSPTGYSAGTSYGGDYGSSYGGDYGSSYGGDYGGDYSSGGGGSYSSGLGTPSSDLLSSLSSDAESPSFESASSLLQKRQDVPEGTSSLSSLGAGSGSSTSPTSVSPGTAALGAAGALGGVAASTALGDVGGLGGTATIGSLTPVSYAMGNYVVSGGFGQSLTEAERESIKNILEENGYSKEEIDAVLNGEYSTSQVLMDSMSDALADAIKNNPELRNEIIEKYGIDIFNADGSINQDKLSMALYLDDMSGKDSYSMISLLSNHGIHLVDQNMLNNYSKEFEKLVLNDYGIKSKIVDRYGFDIFNADGTVNKDRLTLAMLIDSKRNDGISLANIINDSVAGDITGYLNTNIRNANSISDKEAGRAGFVPVAAVLAAGGAAAGIGATTHFAKKKKEEENNQDVEESGSSSFVDKDELDNDNQIGTSWMNDIINESQ